MYNIGFFLPAINGTHDHPFGLGIISPYEMFVYLAERLNFTQTHHYFLQLIVSNGVDKLWTDVSIYFELNS